MNTTTTSPAHTAGDWFYEEFDDDTTGNEPFIVRTTGDRSVRGQVMAIATVLMPGTREEAEANARLIAKAPRLLERITEMRNITESLDYEDGDDEDRMRAMEEALDEIRDIGYATINEVRGTDA